MKNYFSLEWNLCEKSSCLRDSLFRLLKFASCFAVLEVGKFLGLQDFSFATDHKAGLLLLIRILLIDRSTYLFLKPMFGQLDFKTP